MKMVKLLIVLGVVFGIAYFVSNGSSYGGDEGASTETPKRRGGVSMERCERMRAARGASRQRSQASAQEKRGRGNVALRKRRRLRIFIRQVLSGACKNQTDQG